MSEDSASIPKALKFVHRSFESKSNIKFKFNFVTQNISSPKNVQIPNEDVVCFPVGMKYYDKNKMKIPKVIN